MILIIPIILGAAALATAAFGVGASIVGIADLDEAKAIVQRAQKRHKDAVDEFNAEWESTNELAEEYGQFQLEIITTTIKRFVNFIERNIGNANQNTKDYLVGLDGVTIQQIQEYKATVIKVEQVFTGSAKALGASAVGYSGAMSLATSVGVASTGTAISGLSGAAAWNATLAWLGGGSLAAGGGGMALGSLVLGGITVGPALLIGGFVLAGEGEKALTKAQKYEAQINIKIAELDHARHYLPQIQRRIWELADLLEDINKRAVAGLNRLESRPFNKQNEAEVENFRQVALLIKALAEIMKVPVLNKEGKLNPNTANICAKYRTWRG